MIEIGGFFRAGLLAAIARIGATALPAEEIPAAPPEEVGMSSERLREIDAVMQRHIDSGKVQGAITAVARRGKVVHFMANGLMDVERGRAMQEDAIFRMASSSKPVLGVAAMMLIEEGLLSPTDEVAAYLPAFRDMQVAVLEEPADRDVSPLYVAKGKVPEHRLVPAERAITVHHLLTHTSGLASEGLGSAIAELPEQGPAATLASRVPLYAVGHDVVARLIEVVSGLPYDEFVRTRILEPLGMTDTHFILPPEKESRRVVIHGLDARRSFWTRSPRRAAAAGEPSAGAGRSARRPGPTRRWR